MYVIIVFSLWGIFFFIESEFSKKLKLVPTFPIESIEKFFSDFYAMFNKGDHRFSGTGKNEEQCHK